jgi:hypothetical protein
MSSYKAQALIDAPVQEIWELVGNPSRHPDWWPGVIEVRGERFDLGDEYVQVSRLAGSTDTTNFLVERSDPLHEIKLRCQTTGTYAHWLMTEAQGSTFVDVEFGMQPKSFRYKMFDNTMGRLVFRRWLEQSVDALKKAARRTVPGRSSAEESRL